MSSAALIKDWAKGGKEKIATALRDKAAVETPAAGAAHPLKLVLYELCRAVTRETLGVGKLCDLLADAQLLPAAIAPVLHSNLADVFWFLGLELGDAPEAEAQKKQLTLLIQDLLRDKVLSGDLLKARLEPDMLQDVGLVKDRLDFHKKQVRMNTQQLYTQQKYNLFREQSEGYSKLITELSELPASGVGSSTTSTRGCKQAAEVVANIQSLIGFFDLDPNRVLDIVLEALEAVPSRVAHRGLVGLFNPKYIPHMLGFKFQYYHGQGQTPASLYHLCGLLLHQGRVQLGDVLPHLKPSVEELQERHAKRLAKRLEAAAKVGKVALDATDATKRAAARAEREDESRAAKKGGDRDAAAEPEDESPASSASLQPLGLLVALLALRDWRSAEELMGELGEVDAASHAPVCDALCGVLDWLTAPAYAPLSPSAAIFGTAAAAAAAALPAAASSASLADSESAAAEPTVLSPPESAAEAVRAALPVLRRLGVFLHKKPQLFARMCRVGMAALAAAPKDKRAREAVEAGIDCSLLPALAVSEANPGLVHELWRLLELLPYTARYRCYGVLASKMDENLSPELAMAKALTTDATKRMLRRLSKDNTKQYGRHLGKISHSNPGTVFETILSQVQGYDNMIVPIVDMLKYASPMSYDVLSYVVLAQLATPSKDRLKQDGLNVSLWMQSLSSFCGNLYKKYPSIELVGLLQYIANTLKSGQSLQLLLLRDLVTKMSGIEVLEDISHEQLLAQAGGETLRNVVTDLLGIGKNTKRSSTRLKDSLVKHGLVMPLFLLIAQQRSACAYTTDTPHLKMLGELYDRCQETLDQFQAFIGSQLTAAEHAELLPTVGELCGRYQLEPEVAFFIARPALGALHAAKGKDEKPALKAEEAPPPPEEAQQVRDVLPASSWEVLSPHLYYTFWSLSLYDIFVPKERYESEVKRLRRQVEEIDRYQVPFGVSHADPEQRAAAIKRKKDKERCLTNQDKLKLELQEQAAHHKLVMARLKESNRDWFSEKGRSGAESINHFLQACVFPRCVFTPGDAVYCAKFVQHMHALGTPMFSTLQYYDKLLRDISVHTFCCTERQAKNLGSFLNASLAQLLHWKSHEDVYKEECAKRPGFSVSFADQNSKKASYEDYVKVVFKWYCKILKSLMQCLESKEYMELRNALHVLTRTIDVFPRMKKLGDLLEKRVAKLREEERKDLQMLASQYHGLLQKAKPGLQTQEQFCMGIDVTGGKDAGNRADRAAATSRPAKRAADNTPEPQAKQSRKADAPATKSPLNPAAPPFTPGSNGRGGGRGGGDGGGAETARGGERKRERDTKESADDSEAKRPARKDDDARKPAPGGSKGDEPKGGAARGKGAADGGSKGRGSQGASPEKDRPKDKARDGARDGARESAAPREASRQSSRDEPRDKARPAAATAAERSASGGGAERERLEREQRLRDELTSKRGRQGGDANRESGGKEGRGGGGGGDSNSAPPADAKRDAPRDARDRPRDADRGGDRRASGGGDRDRPAARGAAEGRDAGKGGGRPDDRRGGMTDRLGDRGGGKDDKKARR